MADLFISYSRKNKEFVRALADRLAAANKDVWVDWQDIPPTADWEAEIHGGIDAAGSFAFVITPDSLDSDVCRRELEHAVAQGKRIVPLLHSEANQARVPAELASRNWIFFRPEDDFDQSFEKLTRALETDLDRVRAHTRLLVRAREWETGARDGSLLLRGGDLASAEAELAMAAGTEPQPTELQHEYVHASRKAAVRRQRIVFGAVLAALAVSVALGVLALLQRNDAQAQARVATSRALAAEAISNAGDRLDLALLLAAEAHRTESTPEARSALLGTLVSSQPLETFLQAPALVESLAFSPNGRLLAAGIRDGRVIVWATATGERTRTLGRARRPWRGAAALAFSADGRRLAATRGRDVLVWDLRRNRAALEAAGGRGDPVVTLAFDRDGARLAAGDATGSVELVDLDSGRRTPVADACCGGIAALAFGSDGTTLTIGSRGGDVVDHHLVSGRKSTSRGSHIPIKNLSATFSPGMELAASSNREQTGHVSVDAVDTRDHLKAFEAPRRSAIDALAFSTDGRRLAAASASAISVWDVRRGEKIVDDLVGFSGATRALVFSPDAERLASSAGRRIVLWRLAKLPQLAVDSRLPRTDFPATQSVVDIEFAPAGNRVAWLRDYHEFVVWDRAHRPRRVKLQGGGGATRLRFGPDGRTIWILRIPGDEGLLYAVNGETPLRKLTPDEVRAFGDPSTITSKDGRLVVDPAPTGEIVIRDSRSRRAVATLPSREVGSVAIAPAGDVLAATARDGTVVLWDIERAQRIAALPVGDAGDLVDVAFSPDGHTLATNHDGTAVLWDLDTDRWTAYACARAGRELTEVERRQYGVGGSDPICPGEAFDRPLMYRADRLAELLG